MTAWEPAPIIKLNLALDVVDKIRKIRSLGNINVRYITVVFEDLFKVFPSQHLEVLIQNLKNKESLNETLLQNDDIIFNFIYEGLSDKPFYYTMRSFVVPTPYPK
jgi:hypothetical protein